MREIEFRLLGSVLTPIAGAAAASEALRPLVAQVMSVSDTTAGDAYALRFRGQLTQDSEHAYRQLAEQFRALGYTPVFRTEEGQHVIYAMLGVNAPPPSRMWIAYLMFGLTIISMLMAGGLYGYAGPLPGAISDNQVIALFQGIWYMLVIGFQQMLTGWPFMVSLLSILLAHELGHYFMSQYHKVAVSPPYFIPFPLSPFGTMGAVIRLKALPTNRKVLLDIGIAGPLAGLVIAVPVLIYGLYTSAVHAITPGVSNFEGNSILYIATKFLLFGKFLPEPASYEGLPPFLFMLRFYVLGIFTQSGGTDVYLNQVAWAGWAGLLVTGLNLIPVGQLDGGHALYVLLGEKADRIVPYVIGALLLLGVFWQGWWLWAAMIYFLGRTHATPLDEITEIDPMRRLIAIGAIVLFVLVITPIPLSL